MRLFIVTFAFVGLMGCQSERPKVQFQGVDLDASLSVIKNMGFACKEVKQTASSCVKYDGNSSFLGEAVKDVVVDFEGERIQYIALSLKDRSAALADIVELEKKLGSVYAARESKMNMKQSGVLMSHWNASGSAVLRLFVSSGVRGVLPDTVQVIYYPAHMVKGDI